MTPCIKTVTKRFLFWKYESEENRHNWLYKPGKTLTTRKCSRCGEVQAYFGIQRADTDFEYEDWRCVKESK